jgi:hypothetical protein
MTGLIDFAGNDTPDASDDAPLCLVEKLLFPAALAIVVVTFVYAMAYDKLLARRARTAPIRAAVPLQDSLLQPRILAGSIPG